MPLPNRMMRFHLFENVPDSGPHSTPINEGSDGTGDVDYWSGPENGGSTQTTLLGPGNIAVEPTPAATSLLLTIRMPGPTPPTG